MGSFPQYLRLDVIIASVLLHNGAESCCEAPVDKSKRAKPRQ